MASRIIMPQGGQDITEGLVVRWLKREGEAVRRGEVICEVETEKAVFEVESPVDGVLLKIIAREGERVPIFATIGIAGAPGEAAEADRLLESDAHPALAVELPRLPHRAEGGAPEPRRSAASGRAQKLAAEKGVDLAALTGSGPRGRITEKDVLLHVEKRRLPVAGLKGRAVPLSGMRAAVGRRMLRSKQTIPHFYVTVSADMTAALALRQRLKEAEQAEVTVTDLIVKAAALALAAHPRVNCRIEGERIVYFDDVTVGIAVSLEEGVAVPALAGADRLALTDLARRSRELTRLDHQPARGRDPGRRLRTETAGRGPRRPPGRAGDDGDDPLHRPPGRGRGARRRIHQRRQRGAGAAGAAPLSRPGSGSPAVHGRPGKPRGDQICGSPAGAGPR